MEAKLGMRFVTDGCGDLETTFGPEDVFDYAYAVFHSPTYRIRYTEFLKIDFPRLPLTSDKALFKALCEFGSQLVDLHLMRGAAVKMITSFNGQGDNTVANGHPRYTEPTDETAGRVYINPMQYFEGITPELWDFHIGGYQVLEKWLKDRRGRTLSFEDLLHYQRIVVALAGTDRIMDAIDEVIPSFPLP
jgi:predicted helicase